jgi:hypothetical protein
MSFSRDPLFAQKLFTAQKTLTAAKTTLSGVTDATLVYTAPAEGAWITRVWARPLGTLATATRVDLYLSPDGSAAQLIDNELVPASGTLSATTELPETQFDKWSSDTPLYLAGGERLYASLSALFATGIVVSVQGQNFTSPAVADVSAAAGTATA